MGIGNTTAPAAPTAAPERTKAPRR
ncbi:hypothetical protein [Thermus scotoductus]